jgi:multidrug resistance efflux pump
MKARRFRTLFWLLTAAILLVGLTGVIGAFRLPSVKRLIGSERSDPGLLGLQGVECLGRVDIEGGLLDLASVRPGRVVAVPVREGETVSAGAVLLRLDEQPARLQIQTARAAQEAAQVQVALAKETAQVHPSRVAGQEALAAAARSRVSAAREELRRKERLHDRGLIGKEERDSARDEVKALESMAQAEEKRLEGLRAEDPDLRVKLATAEVARATALLAEAQYALEQCVVTAPAAGRVLRVRCGAGEVISPQAGVIVFAQERPRLVRAEVEQELIHLVEVGQPTLVRDEMNPEWSWEGRVARISDWYSDSPPMPRRMARFTDMPTVECVIALDPGHPPLRIGQRMTVLLGKAVPTTGPRSR